MGQKKGGGGKSDMFWPETMKIEHINIWWMRLRQYLLGINALSSHIKKLEEKSKLNPECVY